jgi:hypothetical protein
LIWILCCATAINKVADLLHCATGHYLHSIVFSEYYFTTKYQENYTNSFCEKTKQGKVYGRPIPQDTR